MRTRSYWPLLLLAISGCMQIAVAGSSDLPQSSPSQLSHTQPSQTQPNKLTTEERAAGWRLLFDGESLQNFRSYRKEALSAGWRAEEGELRRVAKAGDLVTRETFDDFELVLDWKVAEGGNSGVFFRAGETAKYIFLTAPEMQILDDAGHKDGKRALTSAGSNYALHPAPRGVVKPAGQWNSMRLLVVGASVRQWLNGQLIVAYELGSTDWQQRVANSKFARWKDYGTLPSGHIGLQDHGDPVAFRNMKLRRLSLAGTDE